ncbi:MAG: anhydro-N-acetylmuramic acid kinase [Candidatus Neomarinimicrobiota bacterium]
MYEKLLSLHRQENVIVLGLMSGTSADGLDICRVHFSGRDAYPVYEVLSKDFIPYPLEFGQAFRRPLELSGEEIAHWHMAWGRWAAKVLKQFCGDCDVLANHGQTLLHRPPDYTLQIGEARCLVQALKKPVICDFRTADVCLGGQGAPLIPVVDNYLLRDERHAVLALNMGGIANVTWLPPKGSDLPIRAWDTGPANTLIDKAVADHTKNKLLFDRNGDIARRGKTDPKLLHCLLQHPYLQRDIPKSAGQEQFGNAFYREVKAQAAPKTAEDWASFIRTLTEFTVHSIAGEIRKRLPEEPLIRRLFASGGGAENSFIMERLQAMFPESDVRKFDLPGIDSGSKEAFGFAYLGYLFLRGLPGNVPSVTGASESCVLGTMYF